LKSVKNVTHAILYDIRHNPTHPLVLADSSLCSLVVTRVTFESKPIN
jgi:hypothetical protein